MISSSRTKRLQRGHKNIIAVTFLLLLCAGLVSAQVQPLPKDTLLQRFVDLRYGMYLHFNMNTFYPGWGEPRQDPKLFNPTKLDCSQWAKAAKAAGMTFAVLTTKHHDGFCLWPSKMTPPNGLAPYTVAQSSVPAKDIVKEYVDAFRAQGVTPMLYYSIWDAACGVDGSSWTKDSAFILGQLTELLGGAYGDIPFLVIDGWSWKVTHQKYPYQVIREHIRRLQPNCLIMDHHGWLPSPWEHDVIDYEEGYGFPYATNTWVGCDENPIGPGWFWDGRYTSSANLMTVDDIVNRHCKLTEARWCNFLLNCPPNRTGLLDSVVVQRLAEAGLAWKPDTARGKMPEQLHNVEHPVTPVSATASSTRAGSAALNAADGDPFSQRWWISGDKLPQQVTLDLGAVYYNLEIFSCLPRQDYANANFLGNVTSYSVSLSKDNVTYREVAAGTWAGQDQLLKTVGFPPDSGRYVRFLVKSAQGTDTAYVNEIGVGGRLNAPTTTKPTVAALAIPAGKSNAVRSGQTLVQVVDDHCVLPSTMRGWAESFAVYSLGGKRLGRISGKTGPGGTISNLHLAKGVYMINTEPSR